MGSLATTERLIRAAPALAITAAGLGPPGRILGPGSQTLDDLRHGPEGHLLAIDTAGVIGRRLLQLVATFGGTMTDEELRFQAGQADLSLVASELERLISAGLLEMHAGGEVRLPATLLPHLVPIPSMTDHGSLTSDEARLICRRLDIATPTRKGERIAAINAHFRSEEGRRLVLKGLSAASRRLFDEIAARAPHGAAPAAELGLGWGDLNGARSAIRRYGAPRSNRSAGPLHGLVERGIVGVSEWEGTVWLWREALPLVESPFFDDWQVAPRPAEVSCAGDGPGLPSIVSAVDGALRYWAENPPNVLKSGERRLAKAAVRSTAKALGVEVELIDMAAGMVLDIGLLLPNAVSTSGRGRNRRTDEVWLADPTMVDAWRRLTAPQKWVRLVASWCRPGGTSGQQLQWNRLLVLWELGDLEPGVGLDGDEAFGRWIEGRYATLGLAAAVTQVLSEVRLLGLVAASGPIGLTESGRLVLGDPAAAIDAFAGAETSVIVQGDLTILAPPNLDPELRTRLDELAGCESGGSAQLLRLDEARIVRAVQAGRSAVDIIAFLTEVSSVPLVDAVVRLVHDAARRADRMKLLPAASLVVVDDPADLRLACSVKAAKLEAVTDTVALSPLPLDKVRSALERKGLAPSAVQAPAVGRSVDDEIIELRDRAARHRQLAKWYDDDNEDVGAWASELERQADELADPSRRLQVTAPLMITPEIAASLMH
jgi:hypothetical protein